MIGRLETLCIGRHPAWSQKPYGGRKPVVGPPVVPESVDPWSVDADVLRKESRHYSACHGCNSQGKIACEVCAATGRVACGACSGVGKVQGTTAAGHVRELNCKSCRGKGDVSCSECSRGRITCALCHGKKKLDRWLEITEETRIDVQVEPDGAILKAFPWGRDGVHASDEEIAKDAMVLFQREADGGFEPSALASHLPPDWIEAHWDDIAPRLRPGERLGRQRFTLLDVPAVEVTYTLDGTAAQMVELEGLRFLAPPPQTDELFHRRARRLKWTLAGLGIVPTLVGTTYLARDPYFHSSEAMGVVAALALAGCAIYAFFAAATLGRRHARIWLGAAVLPLVAATVFAIVAEPSRAAANDYVETGELEAAKRELDALGDPSDPKLAPLWARVHLAETLRATDVSVAKHAAESLRAESTERAAAVGHIDSLLARDAREAMEAGQFGESRALLAETSPGFKESVEAKQLRATTSSAVWKSCLARFDWSCSFSEVSTLAKVDPAMALTAKAETLTAVARRAEEMEKQAPKLEGVDDRVDTARAALDHWKLWNDNGGGELPARLEKLEASLERDLKTQARNRAREAKAEAQRLKREERQRAREAKAEARRLAREGRHRAREAKRRERQERRQRRAYAPLQCCDGSDSPSCTCGGSQRGCCSHHGGVCGCSE